MDQAKWPISVRAKELKYQRSQVQSLKAKCITTVINYSKTYILMHKHIFQILPNKLRNDILQHYLKFCNTVGLVKLKPKDSHKLILALMNKDTEVLNIDNWDKDVWVDYDDRLSTTLEQISLNAKNLKSLRVKSTFLNDIVLSPPCLGFLSKMTSLQSLVITAEWVFADDDLEVLAEKFPVLISLTILIVGHLTAKGVRHLLALDRLKELRFFVRDKVKTEELEEKTADMYALFVENMPHLSVVGNKTTDCDLDSGFQFNNCMPRIPQNFKPGVYNLQHLHASLDLPSQAILPELTHLFFRGPMTKVRTLSTISRYSKLHHLTLSVMDGSEAEEFLQLIGHQLTELHLEAIYETLDFYLVMHLCPNLVRFTLDDLNDGFYNNRYPLIRTRICNMKFPKLKEFRVTLCCNNVGLLKFLLMQPNMESIYVSDSELGPEDFNLVVNELPRACYSNLKLFELRYLLNEESDIPAVGKICKFVLPRAPNLRKFIVSWTEIPIFDLWNEQEKELSDLSSSLL